MKEVTLVDGFNTFMRSREFILTLILSFAIFSEAPFLKGAAVTYVYWANSATRSFIRKPVSGGASETLFTLPAGSVVRNVEANDSEGYIYYTYHDSADSKGKLTKIPFGATGRTGEQMLASNITSGIDFPLNMYFDKSDPNPANHRVYFSDGPDDIWSVKTDGTGLILFKQADGLDHPAGIVVDSANGYLYNTILSGLQRRNLSDGLGKVDLYIHAQPYSASGLDLYAGKLYFGVSSSTSSDGVHRVNVDGSSESRIVNTGTGVSDLQIDPVAGKIYWSEPSLGRIRMSNLDGSSVSTFESSINPRSLTLTTLEIPEPETYGLILGGISLLVVIFMRRENILKRA